MALLSLVTGGVLIGVEITSSQAELPWTAPAELTQLSCPVSGTCVAAGSTFSGPGHGEIIKIDGNNLATLALGRMIPPGFSPFDAISCATPSWCMAVGQGTLFGSHAYVSEIFARGDWLTRSGPRNLGGGGLSCGSPSNCLDIANVSTYGVGTVPLRCVVVASHWNGREWNEVQIPGDPSCGHYWDSISCVGNAFCLAAGNDDLDFRREQGPEAYEWNGHSLLRLVLPRAINQSSALFEARCTAAKFCTLISGPLNGWGSPTAAGPWHVWRVVGQTIKSAEVIPSLGHGFFGSWMSCPRLPNCILVGSEIDADRIHVRLVGFEWSGQVWSDMHLATDGRWNLYDTDELQSLDCFSLRQCLAVGQVKNGDQYSGLLERWNGKRWAILFDGLSAGSERSS